MGGIASHPSLLEGKGAPAEPVGERGFAAASEGKVQRA